MSYRLSPLMGLRTPVSGWQNGSPFHAVEELMREMDRFLSVDANTGGSTGSSGELYKTEDGWIFKAQVPGFTREEIDLDVSKNHISVNATVKDTNITNSIVCRLPTEAEFKYAQRAHGDTKLIRGGFPTSIQYLEQIPATLDPTTAEASLLDGILTVRVKSVSKAPALKKIEIK